MVADVPKLSSVKSPSHSAALKQTGSPSPSVDAIHAKAFKNTIETHSSRTSLPTASRTQPAPSDQPTPPVSKPDVQAGISSIHSNLDRIYQSAGYSTKTPTSDHDKVNFYREMSNYSQNDLKIKNDIDNYINGPLNHATDPTVRESRIAELTREANAPNSFSTWVSSFFTYQPDEVSRVHYQRDIDDVEAGIVS